MNVPTDISLQVVGSVAAALLVAAVVALIATPVVRSLAFKIGAVDVPRDSRRMHDHPIPRMGGLAIFFGFILSVLLFLPLTTQLRGMLLGAVVIVILGIFDDIYALSAKLKFAVQIGAALIAVLMGNQIDYLSNPNIFSSDPYWHLGCAVHPHLCVVDRGHHQRRQPDRRAGRPGLRRVHHQLHDHAGHRPDGGRGPRWPSSWPPWPAPALAFSPIT